MDVDASLEAVIVISEKPFHELLATENRSGLSEEYAEKSELDGLRIVVCYEDAFGGRVGGTVRARALLRRKIADSHR